MRFALGLCLSILGLILFFIGTQSPPLVDQGRSATDQPRGTFFFFGLVACLAGVLLIVTDIFKRDEK